MFDRSVFLFSAKGVLQAERPYRPDRIGQDATWRPYIRQTLQTARPVISEPFKTNAGDGNYVVVLTMPVLSRDGKLIGLLTGSLGLTRPEMLGSVAKTRIGQTGYVSIVTSDGKLSCYFEHTIAITDSGPEVLTLRPDPVMADV